MTLRASFVLASAVTLAACGSSGGGSSSPGGVTGDPLRCATSWLEGYASTTRSEPVPPSCGTSPAVCCPGGVPSATCGPLVLDFTRAAGEPERVQIAQPTPGTLEVTIRARARSAAPLPVTVPLVGECQLAVDTAPGASPDVRLAFTLTRNTGAFGQRLILSAPVLSQLEAADLALSGSTACSLASASLGVASLDAFTQSAGAALGDGVEAELCAACPCGP